MKLSEAKKQFVEEAVANGFTERQAAFLFEKMWQLKVEMECMENRLEDRA